MVEIEIKPEEESSDGRIILAVILIFFLILGVVKAVEIAMAICGG